MRHRIGIVGALSAALLMTISGTVAAHDDVDTPGLHGPTEGHLIGTGSWGDLDLISSLALSGAHDDLVADVAVSPDGETAFLANWGADDCAGPETGGQNSPDAGAWIVDIRDLENPKEIGFIPSHQDTRPGEGMHVVNITTKSFQGDILVMNNEQCGKNGKGGVSLWDVTDPSNPKRLSENFGDRSGVRGDTDSTHSAFAWDAGDRAYVVMQDSSEFPDVDILDITNPMRPRLIAEYDLNDYGVNQPELALTDSDLHDMVVKQIDGKWILLASYWDGGYVLLDVTIPTVPVFIGDTDYPAIDPQLFERTGIALSPEGNGHQAEFTLDDKFFIATDEDFGPYRLEVQTNDGGAYLAKPGTQTSVEDALAIAGTTIFVGRGCNGDAAVPAASTTGGPYIAVVERGLCTFEEKVANIQAATGYDAVIIFNREGSDACTSVFEPFLVNDALPVVFIGREAGFGLFDIQASFNLANCLAGAAQAPLAVGITGDVVTSISSSFDGWGYVHLYGRESLDLLDTYAIPEAHDPAFASGFGDLSVHEVATDPLDASRAYLSYYSGGVRMIEIVCANPADEATCDLVEVGGYLGAAGNDVWGVEAFARDGQTYVLGSDRDSGLLIFGTN